MTLVCFFVSLGFVSVPSSAVESECGADVEASA